MRKPGTRIAAFALGLSLTITLAVNQVEAFGHVPGLALAIDEHGCRFSPQITRVLSSLPQYSDGQIHTEQRAASFPFEGLHGVGVVENWDGVWSEDRLYYREDLSALKDVLGRIGFRVDVNGQVGAPAALQDEMALSIEVHANDGRYFAQARSYLACSGI